MKHRHVIKRFQAWSEGRAGEDERLEIRHHLDECDHCRRYFTNMTKLMEGVGPDALPRLQPDPFLPDRIRAIANSDPASMAGLPSAAPFRPAFGRLAAAVIGVAAVAAAALGVMFGTGLAGRVDTASQAENVAIAQAYYDAFSPAGIQANWESALETDEEDDS
jgi:predicted anti-sigma-YlaC factor YlaD